MILSLSWNIASLVLLQLVACCGRNRRCAVYVWRDGEEEDARNMAYRGRCSYLFEVSLSAGTGAKQGDIGSRHPNQLSKDSWGRWRLQMVSMYSANNSKCFSLRSKFYSLPMTQKTCSIHWTSSTKMPRKLGSAFANAKRSGWKKHSAVSFPWSSIVKISNLWSRLYT